MANTILGLDLGTHSIKLVKLAMGRDPQVLGYDIELLPVLQEAPAQPPPGGPHTTPGTVQGGGGADFEDSPTQVRRRDEVHGAPDAAAGHNSAPVEDPTGNDGGADNDWTTHDDAPPRAPWQLALEQLVARGALDADALIATYLPANQAMSIRQELPFAERNKVENILGHMLNDRLPVDTSKVVYDFQILKKGPDAAAPAEALVGFARREQMGAFLDELKPFQINPALVGIPELMLSSALKRANPHPGEAVALVDIGHTWTRMLVRNGDDPVVARSMQFGGLQLTEAIAERFDTTPEQAAHAKETRAAILDPEQAGDGQNPAYLALSECLAQALHPLIRDLRRTFQALYRQQRVEVREIFVCGGTSLLAGLPEHLTRELGVQVSRLPLGHIAGLEQAAGTSNDLARLVLAASAALQQVDARDPEQVLNLRQQEFSYRGKSSWLRSQWMRYGAAAAVLFLLLMGMFWSQKVQLEAQRDAMRAALGEQTNELFGEPIFSHASIEARLKGEGGGGKSFIPRMSAYELYYQIASHIPAELKVRVDRLEVDVERNIVQLYAETTSPQAVEQLIEDLRKIDCLQDVRQEGELRIKSDNAVDFHLHISSECA